MKRRILILEDDQNMRLFLKAYLEDHFEVVTAKDGYEGMKRILAGVKLDLIVVDASLSGINSVALLTQLRESDFSWNIPVVVIGSKHAQDELRQCLDLGVAAIFVKPFDPQKFLNKIQQVLLTSARGGSGVSY